MNPSAPTTRICSECGEPIPGALRVDHCPTCLLGLALETTVGDDSPATILGESFGDYEVLELLGEGGMGIVYKARQRKLNRIVAVKLMRAGSFASATEIRRFRSEAQAAAKLSHPGVVAIHEVGEENGRPFFSMDFIQGQNLSQVIRRTPLAPERAARYVRGIADAIQYAHERGILHRDLKPANILVDESDRPRITDFGLAKIIETHQAEPDSDTAVNITLPGTVLGTPSYMPPEQARGRRQQIGPTSDVYSLGAILYDCLTGRPPFRADTPLDTLRQVIETEPAAPRLLNPKVPRDLETICLKCLAKEQERRYASARELVEDLDRFLSGQPILARPIGWAGRTWRWSRRNPLLAGVSTAAAALLVMMAWAALVQREYAMINVEEAASLTARLVEDELKPVKSAVSELASNPALAENILRQDTNALNAMLVAHLEKHQALAPRWLRLQNWVVMTPDGSSILRWPQAGSRSIRVRSVRDYFTGPMRIAQAGSDAVYVSRAYQSAEDDGYKFALSQAVRDPNHNIAGVISLMVSPTDLARESLGPRSSGREVILVAEWDSSKPASTPNAVQPRGVREFRIVFHPTFGASNRIAPIHHPYLERISDSADREPLGDFFYRDPLAGQRPKYRGWWLAGFAQIPNTSLAVIYQTRDWVIDAMAVAAVIGGAMALILGVSWYLRRRRFRRST